MEAQAGGLSAQITNRKVVMALKNSGSRPKTNPTAGRLRVSSPKPKTGMVTLTPKIPYLSKENFEATTIKKAVGSRPPASKPEIPRAAQKRTDEPQDTSAPYKIKDKKGRWVIFLGIERGNRIVVRWPSQFGYLNQQLDNNTSAIGHLLGNIETLKDGSNKILIPLNYYNAKKVLTLVKQVLLAPDGRKLYQAKFDDAFLSWFAQEEEAEGVVQNAAHLLDYDDSIQTEFGFLKKPLYPWQSAGFKFLDAITRHGRGAFVCDETGLGKTYTVTAHLKSQGLKAVVIAPAGVCESWSRKIADISDLTTYTVGPSYPLDAYKYDVIIISYAMLKQHGIWPLINIIDNQHRVLIADEGHYAKNYDSKRTSLCLKLAKYAKHTVVVTATPLKNRIKELHPLLRMTRRLWTEESMDDFSSHDDTEDGRKEIAERLSGFMMRRMFKEVKPEFPSGEVGEAWVELSNREDYQEAERNFIQWLIRQGTDPDKLQAAERGRALVKLNHLRKLSAEGKIEQANELIGQTLAAGEQCIVFCAFNSPLFQLAQKFANTEGVNFKGQHWKGSGIIVGSVSKKKRYQLIDAFTGGKLGLLCIGVGAGGLGIDLPIARFAYFLDLPWSPADFEQCTGRILRLGQERDCQFIKLLASNTIDQRMEEIIQAKAAIFQEAIGDENAIERVTSKEAHHMQSSVVSMLLHSYIKDAIDSQVA